MTINMLNLANYIILDMEESRDDYRFLVQLTISPPSHCHKCGTVSNLYKHGKKQQLFFDLPMHAKRVGLFIKRQRYKCRECNETFFENLPDMDVNRSVTNRLLDWIQVASLEKTFTIVAYDIGINEKTVRNIFNDYVTELEAQTDFRTPKWLGIDEVHLLKNYRCVITDVGAVVGADIADPKIEHIHTAVAIILIGLLQRGVSKMTIKVRKFGKLITFEPSIVVHKGNLIKVNLQKVRYSIDNILQMLREKDIFNIADVELAVLEANGRVSVYKKQNEGNVNVDNSNMAKAQDNLAFPLILEGVVSKEVLSYMNKDMLWLENQLRIQNVKISDVFFASINESLELNISQNSLNQIPPLLH